MKRRNILRNVGATGIGIMGLAGSATADSNGNNVDIEVSELSDAQSTYLKEKLQNDRDIQLLLDKASDLGAEPEWDDLLAKRKIVKTESDRGKFDTVVIPFNNNGGNGIVSIVWNGNDDVGLSNSTEVLRHVEPGATLSHISVEEDEALSNQAQPTATDYRIENGELYEVNGARIENFCRPPRDFRPTGNYCEVDVAVLEQPSGILPTCLGINCLSAISGISLALIFSCVSSGQILVCLAGVGVGLFDIVDCITCERTDAIVEFDADWLEENYGGIPDIDPHPCEAAHPVTPTYIPIFECDLEDAPTREDYNFPNC